MRGCGPGPRRGNAVELSFRDSFGFIDLPFIDGFLGYTGWRGSWRFRSIITHTGNFIEEFAENGQGQFRALGREDKGFFSQSDHGMFELGFGPRRMVGMALVHKSAEAAMLLRTIQPEASHSVS